jgi:membrane-associated phospholipid phosphatase
MRQGRGGSIAVAVSVLVGAASARAEPSAGGAPSVQATAKPEAPPAKKRPPVEWDRGTPAGASTYFTTFFLGASTLMLRDASTSPPAWRERDPLDEAWRNAFRSPSVSGRVAAMQASNALDGGLAGLLLVDWVVPFARSPREASAAFHAIPSAEGRAAWVTRTTAWQLAWIDAQAIAFSTFIQNVMDHGVARERPYGRLCGAAATLPDGSDCAGAYRYQSFYSGHTSLGFAAAGLTCVHHAYLPLYGGPAADASACIVAEAVAATVGVLRTVGDQHYLTDVLTGVATGTLSGVGIPLLYYRGGLVPPRFAGLPDGFFATIVPTPTGGSLIGAF